MEKSTYSKLKISGMNYVRIVENEKGEVGGYLLISNENRPIINFYKYLNYCKRKRGNSLNTLKRITYDLCYFFDFMLFNKINEELMNYDYFFKFINEYLPIVNPNFVVKDAIDRSMLKKIPILDEYKNSNIIMKDKFNSMGLNRKSIIRIANNTMKYLVFIKDIIGLEVNIDDMFMTVVEKYVDSRQFGLTNKREFIKYSVINILKNSGLPISKERITSIDESVIFEQYEEDLFFQEVNINFSITYQLLFYLLSITGMRISEALAIKIFDVKFDGISISYKEMRCDLILKSDVDDIWEVNIIVRKENPPDLRIKFNKERKVIFIDKTKIFRNLLTQMIMFRKSVMKKNKKNHEYLFINRSGNRLRYDVVIKTFYKILENCGLEQRKGQLVIHSFRHTYASKWIKINEKNGCDTELEGLKDQLGHASSNITKKIYIHLFKEDIKKIVAKMERAQHQRKEKEE